MNSMGNILYKRFSKQLGYKQLGSTLIEALVAIAIFSFGALGTMAFQANILAHTTLASNRLEATMYVSSLVGAVDADPLNYKCYTYPNLNTDPLCANAVSYVKVWVKQVSNIKGSKGFIASSTLDSSGNLVVSINWNAIRDSDGVLQHNVTSLVHPIVGV